MDTEEKMMHMFLLKHGEATCSCSYEVQFSEEDYKPTGVACMKDGRVCWEESKGDILFDYLTQELD